MDGGAPGDRERWGPLCRGRADHPPSGRSHVGTARDGGQGDRCVRPDRLAGFHEHASSSQPDADPQSCRRPRTTTCFRGCRPTTGSGRAPTRKRLACECPGWPRGTRFVRLHHGFRSHSYLFQSGNKVDYQIEAARDLGVRFHASRGSMSLGESKGGLPPDDVCRGRGRHSEGHGPGDRPLSRHLEVGAMTRDRGCTLFAVLGLRRSPAGKRPRSPETRA